MEGPALLRVGMAMRCGTDCLPHKDDENAMFNAKPS